MRLIVTVHGIRTYGHWQERLENLVSQEVPSEQIDFICYKYGYFSVLAFLVPPLRWLIVRRFRNEIISLCLSKRYSRIDLIGHSFGTHIVGWALAGLAQHLDIKIHTVVLAGSVLRGGFPWRDLLGRRVHRVINDCGTKDSVLLLSQFCVLFTGMAGRTGFSGATSTAFRNRFSAFGHSGYFLDANGAPSDDYMKRNWLPLLLVDQPIFMFDARTPSAWDGAVQVLANNAEPIKLAVYGAPIAAIALWIASLYAQADQERTLAVANESRALTALAEGAQTSGRSVDAMKLVLSAWPRAKSANERPQLTDTLAAASTIITNPATIYNAMRHPALYGAKFSATGKNILTWGLDGILRVWDISSGLERFAPLVGYTSTTSLKEVKNVSDSADYYVTGTSDGTLSVWDATSGQKVTPSLDIPGEVNGSLVGRTSLLFWGGDGLYWSDLKTGQIVRHSAWDEVRGVLVTASEDGILAWSLTKLQRFDVSTGDAIGKEMAHDARILGVKLSRDDRLILSWAVDGMARLWNFATGDAIATFLHTESVEGATFSADDATILTWSEDHTARLWRASDGAAIGAPMTHNDSVRGAQFSNDGNRVLTWSYDGTLRWWNAATGDPIGAPIKFDGPVYGAKLVDDDRLILGWSSHHVNWLDAETGQVIGSRLEHRYLNGAALSNDLKKLLTWSGNEARLWDVERTKPELLSKDFKKDISRIFSNEAFETIALLEDGSLHRLDIPTMRFNPMGEAGSFVDESVSPDRRLLALWARDGVVRLLRTSDGKEICSISALKFGKLGRLERKNSVKFSTSNSKLLVTSGPLIRLVNIAQCGFVGREVVHPAIRPEDRVNVFFNEEANQMLTWSVGMPMHLWRADTGELLQTFRAGSSNMKLMSDQHDFVSSDGDLIRRWNSLDGKPRDWSIQHFGLDDLQILSNGDRFLSSSSYSARLWNSSSGEAASSSFVHESMTGARLSDGGTHLVTWSKHSGDLRYWDVKSGVMIGQPFASRLTIWAAHILDKDRVLSIGDEGFELWDTNTGQPIVYHEFPGRKSWNAMVIDGGQKIMTWSGDGLIQILRIPPAQGTVLDIVCSLLPNFELKTIANEYGVELREPICEGTNRPSSPTWTKLNASRSRRAIRFH